MPTAHHPAPPLIRAKVVKDGNSLAVRLPASLGFQPGEEVALQIRRVAAWPSGYFEVEPSPDFPMPDRKRPEVREARKKRLFGPAGGF